MSNRLTLKSAFIAFATLSQASPRFSYEVDRGFGIAKREIQQGQCSPEDFERFADDYNAGIGYANKVATIIDVDNFYWESFMPQDHQEDTDIETYKNDYLSPFSGLHTDTQFTVIINCRSSQNSQCYTIPPNTPPGYHQYAVTDSETNTITLCDAYFSQPAASDAEDSWCTDGRFLDEFETGAFTLLHEFGHLNYKLQPLLQDYAYGSARCQELAESNEAQAWNNADSWMLVALGAYWADRCGHDIDLDPEGDSPTPQTTPSSTSATPTPTPTSTTPPYATGTCRIHINEWEVGCQNETSNLHAEITMWDNSGTQIGYTKPAKDDSSHPGNFPGINNGQPLEMASSLSSVLEVTGEHENDYIQFTLKSNPQLSWTSRDEQGTVPDAYCNNGGWDPRDGSQCVGGEISIDAKNQVDCWFKC